MRVMNFLKNVVNVLYTTEYTKYGQIYRILERQTLGNGVHWTICDRFGLLFNRIHQIYAIKMKLVNVFRRRSVPHQL